MIATSLLFPLVSSRVSPVEGFLITAITLQLFPLVVVTDLQVQSTLPPPTITQSGSSMSPLS